MKRTVRCAIMRGGTSKAVVFAQPDLPTDEDDRDRLILAAFGSPDPRQVDGLGGADPLTSKMAIVARSSRAEADIDYTFGQVGIASPVVNYGFSCGNTAAAVALYAAEERLVEPVAGVTRARIHCTNNNKRISAQVETNESGNVRGSRSASSGDAPVAATVQLEFHEPGGGDTGSLLPTGAAVNEIQTRSGTWIRFSLVDCGNLYAIIPATTWSLTGSESPAQLDCSPDLLREIEELREAISERFLAGGRPVPQGHPAPRLKIAIVGRPAVEAGKATRNLNDVSADVVARIINPERVHKAFAVTGAMNLAAAAAIRGSVVAELLERKLGVGRDIFRIRHPQGHIAPEVIFESGSSEADIRSIRISRTARRIMDGFVHVPDRSSRNGK